MPVNSASIPALITAGKVRRRRRKRKRYASGGSPTNPALWDVPEEDLPAGSGLSPITSLAGHIAKSTLWDLPHKAINAAKGTSYGLRREDFTDVPPDYSPDPNSPLGAAGIAVPKGGWQPTDDLIGASLEGATNVMAGATPFAASLSKAGETALGIVPVDAAKAFNIKAKMPTGTPLEAAARNTPGAAVDADALTLPVTRNQRPEQALEESVRGGVFYLPKGSKDARFYSGKNENFAYGGQDTIQGETAFKAPLVVKGATGGKAPEAAFDMLNGKGAYQSMRTDALQATGGYGLSRDLKVESVSNFLSKYAPEMEPMAWQIVANSTKGNQLAYAMQEAAVASAVRAAGHDGVVGYSIGRKNKEPFISEVFDVRESHYPSKSGEYETWPSSAFGGQGKERRATGGSVNAALDVARAIKRKKGGRVHIGPIVGDTGGRADKVPMKVPDGSYVIPADIVSGLGEGNTGAGMVQLGKMFPKSKPRIMRESPGAVPILAADGEFVVSPDSILDRWDDLAYGHQALDAWVLHERQQLIETLEGLDPPAQD